MNESIANTWAGGRRQAKAWLAALDRLPLRTRVSGFAAVVFALAAIEVLWIWPMHERRSAIVSAVSAERDAAQRAGTEREQRTAEEQQALAAKLARVDDQLRALGASERRGETLAGWLQRALGGQAVQLLTLRDLGVQELERTPGEAAGNEAAAPAAAVPLYRHRYEITLVGDVLALGAAVQALGEHLTPMRIERLHLGAVTAGGEAQVRATLGLVVIAPERTWITL